VAGGGLVIGLMQMQSGHFTVEFHCYWSVQTVCRRISYILAAGFFIS